MQHGDVLEIRAHIDREAKRTVGRRVDRKKRLDVGQRRHPHPQAFAIVINFGRAVLVDNVDDVARKARLATIEEQQLLECMPLLARHARGKDYAHDP